MSDYQIFSNYTPVADAGELITLTPSQTLEADTADPVDFLQVTGPNSVTLTIEGPQVQLTPADIAGVYPAPGSEESPDEFLPHIALERRTLPWERKGPNGIKPWLALMLLTESEIRGANADLNSPASTLEAVKLKDVKDRDHAGYTQLHNVVKLGDTTPLNVIYLKNSIWLSRRPHKADLPYTCHVRQELAAKKERAIVMAYRLPYAGDVGVKTEIHTALLVSLEGRDDLYDNNSRSADAEAVLILLHHWTFKPSTGGDFEQVIRSIAIQPNGGVLRFGNLPKEAESGQPVLSGGFQTLLHHDGFFQEALPHTQPGMVTWRSPLRPFEPPKRTEGFAVRAAPEEFDTPQPGNPLDYSNATAFELGRLLAFARPEILQDLRGVCPKVPPIEPQVGTSKIPIALQKRDWVTDPAWEALTEDVWSMQIEGQLDSFESLVKGEKEFLENGIADIGGIAEQSQGWVDDVVIKLGGMSTPVSAPVAQINIGTATPQGLANTFADLQTLGS